MYLQKEISKITNFFLRLKGHWRKAESGSGFVSLSFGYAYSNFYQNVTDHQSLLSRVTKWRTGSESGSESVSPSYGSAYPNVYQNVTTLLCRATKWRTCTGWWSGRRVRRGRGACPRAPSSPTTSGCGWRASAAGWDSRPSPSSGAGIRWSSQRSKTEFLNRFLTKDSSFLYHAFHGHFY